MDEPQHTQPAPPESHGPAAEGTTPAAATPADETPRFADSYGVVLLLLIATFFATAIAGDSSLGRVLTLVMLAITTWLALRASRVRRRLVRLAVALIPLVTLIAVIAALVGNASTAKLVSTLLTVLLVLVAPPAIAMRLTSHPVISANAFYGAVCVYLLLAMLFATGFAFLSLVTGHAFFMQQQNASSTDYLYFSFTTITTVGYGDLTARGNVGRMMAVLEAVLGQLYLITVVALVVQNLSAERRRRRGQ